MIYDIIIIGGGISGLYTAYKLLQKNNKKNDNKKLKILILEKNNYLGGRIKTYRTSKNSWEEGAGRFNTKHVKLLKLIDELGLSDKIININAKIKFYPSGKYDEKFIHKSPFIYINKVIEFSKKITKEELQKLTFIELSKKILSPIEIKFILDSFGYYAQLIKMNSWNAIHLFENGMNPKNKFFSLMGGMDQIVSRLKDKIIELGGKIKLNTNVTDIKYIDKFYITTECLHKKLKACKVILAVPKPDLLLFHILKQKNIQRMLNSINYKSLCRIYSIFPKDNNNNVWFNNISKLTTNNKSRYIIPINKESGLIMISYSDSKFADYWQNLYKTRGISEVNSKLKENTKKTLNIEIPKPIFTKLSYWKCAIGFWKKNKDSQIISKKIIKPIKDIDLYICGENYSETQGWIEGALETSSNVINRI
jgi:monoamine oxidase